MDQFRRAEEDFLRLRGQLEVGRIAQKEFDDAVKRLMVQDAQGRYWSLGPDTGKWYVNENGQWIQSEPDSAQAARPAASSSRTLPLLLAALGGLALCICVLGGIVFGMSTGVLTISTTKPTATFPPLPPVFVPTAIALVTNTPVLPTAPPPAISIPPANLTPTLALTETLPTATLTLTPTVTQTITLTPTLTLTPTATATLTPMIPPGVYVTEIRTEPNPPPRQQPIGFHVTFLNNTGAPQTYRWLVYVYRVENSRNSFGETAAQGTAMPVGALTVKTINDWRSGIGPCENFFARVAWIDDNRRSIPFTGINGQPFEHYFQVC